MEVLLRGRHAREAASSAAINHDAQRHGESFHPRRSPLESSSSEVHNASQQPLHINRLRHAHTSSCASDGEHVKANVSRTQAITSDDRRVPAFHDRRWQRRERPRKQVRVLEVWLYGSSDRHSVHGHSTSPTPLKRQLHASRKPCSLSRPHHQGPGSHAVAMGVRAGADGWQTGISTNAAVTSAAMGPARATFFSGVQRGGARSPPGLRSIRAVAYAQNWPSHRAHAAPSTDSPRVRAKEATKSRPDAPSRRSG